MNSAGNIKFQGLSGVIAEEIAEIAVKEAAERALREGIQRSIIEGVQSGITPAARQTLEKVMVESYSRSLQNTLQKGLLEGTFSGTLKELSQKIVTQGFVGVTAKEVSLKMLSEGVQGSTRQAAERIILSTSTSTEVAGVLIKDAGGNAAAKTLVKTPTQTIREFVSRYPKLTVFGFTVAGASLYFGIQAARGISPSDAADGITDLTGDSIGVLVRAANSAAADVLNSSGIFDFLKDLWEKYKNYIYTGGVIMFIVCIIMMLK